MAITGWRRVAIQLQSSSSSRRTAGAAGFLIFSQCGNRPARYGVPSRFETMPSQPSAHALDRGAVALIVFVKGDAVMWEPQQPGEPAFKFASGRTCCSSSGRWSARFNGCR